MFHGSIRTAISGTFRQVMTPHWARDEIALVIVIEGSVGAGNPRTDDGNRQLSVRNARGPASIAEFGRSSCLVLNHGPAFDDLSGRFKLGEDAECWLGVVE